MRRLGISRASRHVKADGVTNVLDRLLCFGPPAAAGCEWPDINGDGSVTVLDLIDRLLSFLGVPVGRTESPPAIPKQFRKNDEKPARQGRRRPLVDERVLPRSTPDLPLT